MIPIESTQQREIGMKRKQSYYIGLYIPIHLKEILVQRALLLQTGKM